MFKQLSRRQKVHFCNCLGDVIGPDEYTVVWLHPEVVLRVKDLPCGHIYIVATNPSILLPPRNFFSTKQSLGDLVQSHTHPELIASKSHCPNAILFVDSVFFDLPKQN